MADFVTGTELVVRLDLPHNTQPTDRVLQAIAGASAAVREACGWHIWPVQAGLVATGTGTVVAIPGRNVAVTAVTLDGLVTDYWRLDPSTGLVFITWPRRGGLIEATYTAGYADVPEAVRDVCLDEAVARYGNPENARDETVGGTSMSYSIRPDLRTDPRLRKYRVGVLVA